MNVTVPVPRHVLPGGLARRAEALDESAAWHIRQLDSSPEAFTLAFGTSCLAALTHCGEDPRAADLATWESWVTAMQVGSALFATSTATAGTVECRIADEVRTLQAGGPQYAGHPENWISAFWLAIVCREPERLTALARVPVEVLRASGAECLGYVYSWVETLQTWWLRGGDLGASLDAAIAGTDPEGLHRDDRGLMLQILYPPMNLFLLYVTADHAGFNEALAEALQWHKEYWTRLDEGAGAGDSNSLVALGPLAMACLAHDAGFPLTIESDYLPKHLVAGSWVGEFDTLST
ncbi:immunity 49 family protein [Streptomyces sp. SPB4]|uniref:immunity 49 family protein n=1 Tax=Streptomyces sp. SPB4 TaxID=2940553 RepID=UPI0024730D9F|nr:immunity 49 family protein [Streptomyces sp. SPB4]